MNMDYLEFAQHYIEKDDCILTIHKKKDGSYDFLIENLGDFGYEIRIYETEPMFYNYYTNTVGRKCIITCKLNFVEKGQVKIYEGCPVTLCIEDFDKFIDKAKKEQIKLKHELTGRYGLISQILPSGEKMVVDSFGEYTDDALMLEDRCKEIVEALNETYKDLNYTYNIVDLGVGKNEKN